MFFSNIHNKWNEYHLVTYKYYKIEKSAIEFAFEMKSEIIARKREKFMIRKNFGGFM